MTTAILLDQILGQRDEVRARCPELRCGQLIATIGMLAEDETGFSLWDVEDADFAVALARFAADLARRESGAAEPDESPDCGGSTAPPTSITPEPSGQVRLERTANSASRFKLPSLLIVSLSLIGCGEREVKEQPGANPPRAAQSKMSSRQLYDAFQKVKVGMTRAEINERVGDVGRIVVERYDLRVGPNQGIIIKDGIVKGSWSMSEEGHAKIKKIELGMTEAQVQALLEANTYSKCEVYHWGDHEPPFEVSFSNGVALRVSGPQETALR